MFVGKEHPACCQQPVPAVRLCDGRRLHHGVGLDHFLFSKGSIVAESPAEILEQHLLPPGPHLFWSCPEKNNQILDSGSLAAKQALIITPPTACLTAGRSCLCRYSTQSNDMAEEEEGTDTERPA
ncbi:hypothetical protein XENOCAPTIV_010284 [Xenoophorus captivus]|uniref:Uncharacterized protein n=1 Tax=Xenoophorus captivus TaxID=1517983 RepID=A0ABV0S8K0_9TELE